VTCELDLLVVGKTFVLTRESEGSTTKALREELARNPRLLVRGPAWIAQAAQAALDHLVDAFLPASSPTRTMHVRPGSTAGPRPDESLGLLAVAARADR
jgi:hypothetical protein